MPKTLVELQAMWHSVHAWVMLGVADFSMPPKPMTMVLAPSLHYE